MTDIEQEIETKSTKEERISTGRKFYFTAWVVEIVAATIGLTIAWSQGYASYLYLLSENEGIFPMSQLFNLFIAALPFIMVAIAELLKIPFAYLVYMNRRLLVKVVYSFVLLTVTIITFETLIFGFERQYTNITQQVRVPQKQLDIINIKLTDIDKRTIRLESQTEGSIKLTINEMLQSAKQNKDFDIENYTNQKNALYKSTNSPAYSQIEILQQENNQIESQSKTSIGQLQETLKVSIKEESSNIKQRTINQNKQIDALRNEILRIEEKIASKEVSLGALGALFSTDIPKWEKDIVRKDKQIDTLISSGSMVSTTSSKIDKRIENIRNKANNKISENNAKISQLKIKVALAQGDNLKMQTIDENIQIRHQTYADSLSIIEKKRNKMEKDFENRDTIIEGLYADKNKLTEKQGIKKAQIDKAASNSQVYRIAMGWYEKNRASDVTRIEADNVAFFWFGSLALIVSTIGVSLAFGAYILKHPVEGFPAKKRTKSRIIKALMLTLRRLRKRLRNPKIVTKIKEVEVPIEVVKEVPVDKVVFKEVPVEIVKKQVIHVPIYTNDPD
ncbi:MAG TPA: hypothetical protein EYQ06_08800, partial [Flavobacteriales bacterium]|nr:hypothetical protein [Flavobacteriales bacterium]